MSQSIGQRREEALGRAALILASELSLPAVLQHIVSLACEVADARYGALGVVGADGRINEFVTYGLTPQEREAIGPLPTGHGILGVLIMEGKPLRLPRIQDDPRSSGFPPHHPPMTSFLGVPVAIRGTVFGNLYLTEKQGAEEFTEADEDAVIRLATHAAVAVENARLYAEAKLGQKRMSAVNAITNAILAGAEIEAVLALIVSNARELADATIASVVSPDGDDLVVRAADGEGADEVRGLAFSGEGSISAKVMRDREPYVIADGGSGAENQPLLNRGDIGPALFVPLAIGERAFGTLAVGNRQSGRRFTENDIEVLSAFASQAAVALEHARIQDELKRLALVEDRERIAKELHDDIIQSLFAEGMSLQASLSMLGDTDAMEERITQSIEHIDRVIRDLRNYIFALRPGVAADRTLERSLREVAQSFAGSVRIVVVVDQDVASALAGRAGEVLQATREAISNAVRHSGGDHVRVSLGRAGDDAVLEVADDGKGFDAEAAMGRGHGLTNLRDRADGLRGELEIESESGRGSWVRIRMPL